MPLASAGSRQACRPAARQVCFAEVEETPSSAPAASHGLQDCFPTARGLDLRPINGGALFPILCAGAEIDYNQARSQDKLRINPHNNSLNVSTSSEPRMKRYVQLQGLQLNDQQYPMKAYVAAPVNAIKGILYNAVYNQSQEDIFEDLVALNPSRTFTIADARQLGRTKSILVTFINTTEVPRQLNFYGAVYSCHPFKAKVEAYFNCGKPGHGADVCPKERTGLCPRCGIAHPVKPTPDCTPKCILCGGAHFTGTRRCKVRFDRSGNSSNNTATSTTRTTPPANPPPVSPPESSRNSRSHHRSPSRSEAVREQAPDKAAIEAVRCHSRHSQGKKTRTSKHRGAAPDTSRRSWILIRLILVRHVTHTQSSCHKEI
ncbi:hypothetical protein HPB49_005693 [Dermacentor silvarum]|uniref:Uncharacterized protein n=1 Tax=Dermacentor silvarum TaxID=543639 RepID=A0ACB8D3C1_DERSI|nr:hypothetical protein HPB49_005693 [Dermacentor silvarum]